MKIDILIPLLLQDWQPYVSFGLKINLLAPELFFLILAHPVYKM